MDRAIWEHFDHPADMGLRGIGPTPAAAFEQGALALTAVMLPPGEVTAREAVTITCAGADLDYLFVDWLNALLYEMETRDLVFGRFAVSLSAEGLTGQAWGEPLDRGRHRPAVQVKAATLADLQVRQREDGLWVAQCIVDV